MLEVSDVRVILGGRPVLDGLSLSVADGECLVLLGESGCGKTTLLRVIAGLVPAESGAIQLAGRGLLAMPPHERDVALVFQDYALYAHRTVRGNLAFPLQVRKLPRGVVDETVNDVAARLGIGALLDRYPASLSGGEQQRVALGRAMVRQPKVFLLDEPLSHLDATRRDLLRAELRETYSQLQVPIIHVTHDQEEALAIADKVAVMEAGRIVQCGSPHEILQRPASEYVARLVGRPAINLFSATLQRSEGNAVIRGVDFAGSIESLPPLVDGPSGRSLRVGVRPWDVVEAAGAEPSISLSIRARRVYPSPPFQLIDGTEAKHGTAFQYLVGSGEEVCGGDIISVSVPLDRLHLFDGVTGQRLPAP